MRTQSLSFMAVVQESMEIHMLESFLSPFEEYCLYQHQMKQVLMLIPLIQRGCRSLSFYLEARQPLLQLKMQQGIITLSLGDHMN